MHRALVPYNMYGRIIHGNLKENQKSNQPNMWFVCMGRNPLKFRGGELTLLIPM